MRSLLKSKPLRHIASALRRAAGRLHERSSLRRLSSGLLLTMAAGLLVPALVGVTALTELRQKQIDQELVDKLENTAVLLGSSLVVPAWNYDIQGMTRITEAAMLDPQVVRITVRDPASAPLVSVEQPERRRGRSVVQRQDMRLSGQVIDKTEVAGSVEIEFDDSLAQQQFKNDRQVYAFILLGQLLLSLGLMLAALHLWVLKPLTSLSAFSSRVAGGDFEHPLDWSRPDEIGRLALQMDKMRADLKTSFAEQRAILTNIELGVIFERGGLIQLASRQAERSFGHPPGFMSGLPILAIYPEDARAGIASARAMAAIATGDGRHEEELMLHRRDGSQFWAHLRVRQLDPAQPQAGCIWVIEDISARKAVEDEVNRLAFYDPLTQLPNRRLLRDRLAQALAASARSGMHGALIFIDLDNFKSLNDTLGHARGDQLLKLVGQRLTHCVRESDTVARLGGDEFVVIVQDLGARLDECATQAEGVGEKILDALNQPYPLDGHVRHSTPSIGITLFADDRDSVDDLLKEADMAMYQAKTAGRNTLRFFDADMQAMLVQRAALEEDMRESMRLSHFLLHYQPQVVGSGRITGAEVLLRWPHPLRGLVPPAEFIPLAEDTNLITALGHWVLETACKTLADWSAQDDMKHLSVSVNVSARQFRQPHFVAEVMSILERTGADPHLLKLELTESLLVEDVEDIVAKMSALKSRGVGFSLDDFGTGYSSLAHLKRLPLDQLKIDQSFVRDILTDPNDLAIGRMVVALADSLGLTVIAEGVELAAQRELLAQIGCDAYQGYLFSRPLPREPFEACCRAARQAVA
ncbi:diguanylate cyclase/phosphodiesterase with PAS/PAC sensor(s) [Leptothrix cholodnii SP-6]|uniref:Diguanylate cyclase/phosphodiesterase with PAS/PAC sensor(S) n=1 Tax=Leptothrix cholodnii (strain ATCC 51168 / LMG 8142 / SP-6) TaxID=395495 RepID=B1Y2A0_LEPCP|nr:EAL domain-containing protein [Leptothrix cholodnii]ACB35553.1 diguanylate cyclase/phosphodiesterase with PAS/PAC sensor(s) [Leptothrix cholodnii SP-6]